MLKSRRTSSGRALVVVVFFAAALVGADVSPSTATHSGVHGFAYGYQLKMRYQGGTEHTRGYAQVACTGTNTPPGCAPSPNLSDSPSVFLPTSGGNVSATEPDAAETGTAKTRTEAVVLAARLFSAHKMTVSSVGATTPSESVTTTATIEKTNQVPNAWDDELLTVDKLESSCTAPAPTPSGVSGSTAITNGRLYIDSGDDINRDGDFADPGEHGPVQMDLPENPPANFAVPGHIHVRPPSGPDHDLENFVYVFNEQVFDATTGRLTVNGAHLKMLGPALVTGDLVIGRVECGL